LDIALTGSASASTEASGSPAANAIDGSASTDWCSTEWTGSVTVDLGQVRSLDGFGLTLGGNATTALVNLSYGTTTGSLAPVPDAQLASMSRARRCLRVSDRSCR
jgi:F5/8 type C domain